MIRINLLAAERPALKKKAAAAPGAVQAYLLVGGALVGAVVVCAGLYVWKSAQLKGLDEQIARDERRQRELQAIKVQVDAFQAKKKTLEDKVNLIERLKAEQGGPVHMLDEISKSLPDFVWLTGLDQTGNVVKFTGESNSLTSVADFISALQRSGWFPQVDLVSSQEQNNIVTFNLQATFQNPEMAAKEKAAQAAAAAGAAPPAAPKS